MKRSVITTATPSYQVTEILKGTYSKDGKKVTLPWFSIALENPNDDSWTEVVEGTLWIKM